MMSMGFLSVCPSVCLSGMYVMFAHARNHVTCILYFENHAFVMNYMKLLEVDRQRRLQRRRQREQDRHARETPEERNRRRAQHAETPQEGLCEQRRRVP